jgi:flagellar protein FlaG
MNTVTPITNTNHFPSSLSTPVVEKPQYGGRQDTVEKEVQKDIYAPKEPKTKTARKFSTEGEGDSLVHRIRSDREEEKAKEKEVPADVAATLESKEGVQAFAKVLEDYAKQVHNVGLRFSVHEDTGRTVVRIVDEKTDEVVREVPPEELLDLAARMEQMMGMLLDEKA